MVRLALAFLIVSSLLIAPSLAGVPSKIVQAVRAEPRPVIDGWVNEPVWQTAPAILDFTQYDPAEGAPPTEITSVRVLYDNRALYIGVICYDSRPEGIVRQLSRRDRSTEADRFTVMIDSYFDRQSAFVFSTNVSGVQSDGVLSQGGVVYDITWDAVWTVETRVYRDGWSAEFEIPFNALRFAERDQGEYVWGINFRRYISRKRETNEWVMVPRSERLLIPYWGTVQGIRSISPPLHLDVVPYVSGSAQFQTATPTDPATHDLTGQAGLDLKYGLTGNFTLDATVNPDFGQVEVDRAVLNLTVFETLFPEKRPFFVEGTQFFTFGSSVDNTPLPVFFSRRIGKTPLPVTVPPGDVVEESPAVTTILGAAKISGRSGDGFALGALSALTDNEFAEVRAADGSTYRLRAEPRGSYNVVRVRQDFGDQSWIGGIATLVSRVDTLPAYSAGVDWNLRVGNGTHSFDGYLTAARSSVGSTNPDGVAGRLLLSSISAEHWSYAGSYNFFTPDFNINDIGFFARPHDHGGYLQLTYREYFAAEPFLRYALEIVPEARWDWQGINTMAQAEFRTVWELTNFWNVSLRYTQKLPAYSDEEYGIIGTYRRPEAHFVQTTITSDDRKNVVATLGAAYEADARSKRAVSATMEIDFRVAAWFEVIPTLFCQRIRTEETGVYANGGIVTVPLGSGSASLFADRDLDEVDIGLRGIVTFTRTLSLQFFTQMLLARGTYGSYRALTGSTDFVPYAAASGLYDFNEATFNANVLLRWEYLQGSTMYLVWTQERYGDTGDYSVSFPERFRDSFAYPHQDVVLLKVNYWLSF